MPKVASYLVSTWIKSAPELVLDNGNVYCIACAKIIPCKKKFQITQHLCTDVHREKCKKLEPGSLQPSLKHSPAASSSSNTSDQLAVTTDQDVFNFDLTNALLAANVPLQKLQNLNLLHFLQKYCCNYAIPDESTLQENYVESVYTEVMNEIRQVVNYNYIYLIVDESTDMWGRYIAHLLIGCLNENGPGKSYLIASRELDKTDHAVMVRYINETLMNFFLPDIVPTRKILLMVSNAASHLVKAGQQLKVLYSNLIHITCLAQDLNRVAEEIRNSYPKVNCLISNVPKIFVKSPVRVQLYKEKMLNTPLPPQPMIARWGSWLEAACFYAQHFVPIKELIISFEEESSEISECKLILSDDSLHHELSFIKTNYEFVHVTIRKLETESLPLQESLQLIKEFQEKVQAVSGEIGELVNKKCIEILAKNTDLNLLQDANRTLCSNIKLENNLNVELANVLKYAQITSVDVERTFPICKSVVTDKRHNFSNPNVEKYVIVNCFRNNECKEEL